MEIEKHGAIVALARKAGQCDKSARAAQAALVGAILSVAVETGYGLGLQKDVRTAYQSARKCDQKTARRWHAGLVRELLKDARIGTGKAAGPGIVELDPRAADPAQKAQKAPAAPAMPSAKKAWDALQVRVVHLQDAGARQQGQKLLDDLAALLTLDI